MAGRLQGSPSIDFLEKRSVLAAFRSKRIFDWRCPGRLLQGMIRSSISLRQGRSIKPSLNEDRSLFGDHSEPMKRTTKMQFSATIIFRTVIMIGCLVIIPLVAIFRTSLPGVFKDKKPDEAAQTRRDAQNTSPTQRQTKEPDGLVELTQSGRGPVNAQETLQWPSKGTGNIHADFQMPIDADQRTLKNTNAAATHHKRQSVHNDTARRTRRKDSSQAPKDLCTQIEYRLRELGASYYRLEHWGAEGMLYRFQCNVPMDEGTQRSRLFQATDEDRIRAMQRVLKQIESWRSRRPLKTSRSVRVPGS